MVVETSAQKNTGTMRGQCNSAAGIGGTFRRSVHIFRERTHTEQVETADFRTACDATGTNTTAKRRIGSLTISGATKQKRIINVDELLTPLKSVTRDIRTASRLPRSTEYIDICITMERDEEQKDETADLRTDTVVQ